VAVERALGVDIVIEAVESDGLLRQTGLRGLRGIEGPEGLLGVGDGKREVALVAVAGDHVEAGGEGGDVALTGAVVQKVVAGGCVSIDVMAGCERRDLRKETANLVDDSELAGCGILEVERRGPVCGLVLGDGAGGAISSEEFVGSRCGGESWIRC